MAATGLGYATVHAHAGRLWRAGLVSQERDGKARRFRLTELGRSVARQAEASLGRFPKLPKNGPGMDGPA
jgi:DNA-binding transcriptional ArsR family regulator